MRTHGALVSTTRVKGARRARVVALAALALGTMALAQSARAQDARADYKKNCLSCHSIGGGALTGPDLKDVTKRADRAWLVRFIVNPPAVIESGDAYAQKIFAEARSVPMPVISGMTSERAERLLDLIDLESSLPRSEFEGIKLSDRPLTALDVERGRALFTGRERLQKGGASCLGCHQVGRLGALGGGTLGPDLTEVYARLDGRKALGAWLAAPPTAVMSATYEGHPLEADEILPLVALLKDATERAEPRRPATSLDLVLCGLFGVALLLVLLDVLNRRRFRAVRRPLVGGRS